MPEKIEVWMSRIKSDIADRSARSLYEEYFSRDPLRCISRDPSTFLAPCDGVLYSINEFQGFDESIVVKGVNVTLGRLLPGVAIPDQGIILNFFMTTYDVHILRMPMTGFVRSRHVHSQTGLNTSMLEFEETIIATHKNVLPRPDFLHANQRVVSDIYIPGIDQTVHVVQIADREVNSITPFSSPGWSPLPQGSRFSAIRLGSQVSVMIPVADPNMFTVLAEANLHYESGEPLLRYKGLPNV